MLEHVPPNLTTQGFKFSKLEQLQLLNHAPRTALELFQVR